MSPSIRALLRLDVALWQLTAVRQVASCWRSMHRAGGAACLWHPERHAGNAACVPTLRRRAERHSTRRMASCSGLKCWPLEKPDPLAAVDVADLPEAST